MDEKNAEELRVLVDLLGLFAFPDFAFDHVLAHSHPERVDRRILRQRERIHRLGARLFRISETLRDFAAQDHAAHAQLDVGFHGRRRDVHARFAGLQQ